MQEFCRVRCVVLLLCACCVGWVAGSAAEDEPMPAADVPPTLISVDFQGTPVGDAFATLAGRSGQPIRPHSDEWLREQRLPGLTFQANQRPFLEVFVAMCNATGLGVYLRDEPDGAYLLVTPRASPVMNRPLSHQGAFLVVVTRIQRIRRLDLVDPGAVDRSLRIELLVMSDPAARIVRHAAQATVHQAMDERENDFGAGAPPAGGPMTDSAGHFSLALPLQHPNYPSQRLAVLRGEILVIARIGDVERPVIIPFEFQDIELP